MHTHHIEIHDNVKLEDLENYTYLFADDCDEYVTISGEIEESSTMEGLWVVETTVGSVYLDPEFPVRAGNPI